MGSSVADILTVVNMKMERFSLVWGCVLPMELVGGVNLRGPGMYTSDIFELADVCIEAGFLPLLAGRRFVLGLEVPGTGRGIVRRDDVDFRLHCPCRVWLLSGSIRVLLGDSAALPGDLSDGVGPPFTG